MTSRGTSTAPSGPELRGVVADPDHVAADGRTGYESDDHMDALGGQQQARDRGVIGELAAHPALAPPLGDRFVDAGLGDEAIDVVTGG